MLSNIHQVLFTCLALAASVLPCCRGQPGAPAARRSFVADPAFRHQDIVRPAIVQLPNGFKPEGVASSGNGGFYASGLSGQLVYRCTQANKSTVVATEPLTFLTGVKYDASQHKIFVTGAVSGKAFVYTLDPGSKTAVQHRLVLQLSIGGYINDVAIGEQRIYFSDSIKPFIYSIPRYFKPGQQPPVTSHPLSVPNFIGVPMVPILEAANGLAEAKAGVLIVANYKQGQLYKLDTTQASKATFTKVPLPESIDGKRVFPDGLLFTDHFTLFVADNFNNRLLKLRLSPDYTTAELQCVITSPAFNTPTTLAVQDGYLWAVNAHFLDCLFVLPCTWQQYEIVGLKLDGLCV